MVVIRFPAEAAAAEEAGEGEEEPIARKEKHLNVYLVILRKQTYFAAFCT